MTRAMIIIISVTIGLIVGIMLGSNLACAAYRQAMVTSHTPPRELKRVRHTVRWDLTVCRECHQEIR